MLYDKLVSNGQDELIKKLTSGFNELIFLTIRAWWLPEKYKLRFF